MLYTQADCRPPHQPSEQRCVLDAAHSSPDTTRTNRTNVGLEASITTSKNIEGQRNTTRRNTSTGASLFGLDQTKETARRIISSYDLQNCGAARTNLFSF